MNIPPVTVNPLDANSNTLSSTNALGASLLLAVAIGVINGLTKKDSDTEWFFQGDVPLRTKCCKLLTPDIINSLAWVTTPFLIEHLAANSLGISPSNLKIPFDIAKVMGVVLASTVGFEKNETDPNEIRFTTFVASTASAAGYIVDAHSFSTAIATALSGVAVDHLIYRVVFPKKEQNLFGYSGQVGPFRTTVAAITAAVPMNYGGILGRVTLAAITGYALQSMW